MLKISKKFISMPCYLNNYNNNKGRFYFACDRLVRSNNNKSIFNVKVVCSPSDKCLCPVFDERLRFKSKGHGKKQIPEEDSESSDEDEDNNENHDEGKIKTFRLKSVRADNVLKSCFKLSKRKLEQVIFYNKVKLNNEVLTKKGAELSPGDVLELYGESTIIESKNEIIGKVEILSVEPIVEASLIAIKVRMQNW